MDPFKYREVRGTFTARTPDTGNSDQLPDRVLLDGYGTLTPNIRGKSVVFTEVGEFAVPRTRQVVFVDGEIMVEVFEGDASIVQPLFLEVTVDERANQNWSWTLTFNSLTIGESGEQIDHPALTFPVEEGDGPLELSTVATTVKTAGGFITRGERGRGITDITASNGVITVEWEGGDDVLIPIPSAVLATPENDGLMPSADKATIDNLAFTGVMRGIIPENADINLIRTPGLHIVPSVTHARTLVNWPTIRPGHLLVSKDPGSNMTTQDVIAYVSTTSPVERYTRGTISSSATSWGAWSTTEWVKGRLGSSSNPVNADTFRILGGWQVANAGDVTGLPGSGAGFLEIMFTTAAGMSLQRFTERVDETRVQLWHRYSMATTGWAGGEWQPVGSGGSSPAPAAGGDPVSDHAARVEYARSRRGGGIGTAGKPVVMLRFDHWLVAFRDKVLPILREFGLPATLNVNYDNLSNAANGGGSVTWSHVQDWNQYDGIEIANHGSTHTNADTRASIYHEVVDGRRNLEAAMPRVAVETWQEHGSAYLTATDMPGDIGLDLGREPRNFFESYAGKLVLAEHAVIEGKSGGFFHPVNGDPQIGQSHISVDRSTAAEAIGYVNQVQQIGRGVTLYAHPGTLDTVSGDITYMTLAAFRQLCAHLAAERDAGRLMVMTAAGGGFADMRSNRRENILVNPTFAGDISSDWSYTGGWVFDHTGVVPVATSGSASVPMSQAILLFTRFGWAMGATHEILVYAKSTTQTTLTLRLEQLGNASNWATEKIHTIPGDGVLRPYRLNLALPRDRNISQMRVFIGGPNLTIEGAPLFAAI